MRRYRKPLAGSETRFWAPVFWRWQMYAAKSQISMANNSYSDYVYEIRYGRDYTLEDVSQLCGVVRSEIAPLHVVCRY